MDRARKRMAIILTISAVVLGSAIALLGIPHIGTAVRIAPATEKATVGAGTRGWYAPMALPHVAFSASFHSSAAGVHSSGASWAPAGSASSQSSGQFAGYKSMGHCGFMPRYDRLKA